MGCYHESEPAIVEEFGLDLVQVQAFAREDNIDHALYALREEKIAESGEQDVEKAIAIVNPHEQILILYDSFRPRLIRYLHKMYLKR